MKPADDLHREHLAALVTGDLETATNLRKRFDPHGDQTARHLLRAAVAACLETRFGPGAGRGASPADHDTLTAYMAELRAAGQDGSTPPDYLDVEAAIRSLYGEQHLYDALSDTEASQALYALLADFTHRHPWLKTDTRYLYERSQQTVLYWACG
jgi:hypothetical protein